MKRIFSTKDRSTPPAAATLIQTKARTASTTSLPTPTSTSAAAAASSITTPLLPSILRCGKTFRDSSQVSLEVRLDKFRQRVRKSSEEALNKLKETTQEIESFRRASLEFGRSSYLPDQEQTNSASNTETRHDIGVLSESRVGEESRIFEIISLDDSVVEGEDVFTSPKSPSKNTTTDPSNKQDNTPKHKTPMDINSVAKLTSQLVPVFSGGQGPTVSSELQTFLGCCKRVLECLTTEDEKTNFFKIFPTRLRGEAYQLIASSQPQNFEDAEKLLNASYLPRETYHELVNKLITTRQYPLEALITFTARVKQMLMLCKEAADSKYGVQASPTVKTQLEDFAKNALRSGVNNPHLCQYLLTLSEDSFDTLVQKALDMERLQQSALNIIPSNPSFTYTPPYTTTPSNTKEINTDFYTQPEYSEKLPSFNYPTETYPHQNNLPVPINKVKREPNSPKSINSILANITCNFCKKKGHTYTDCLKRKNTPFCTNCEMNAHDVRDCRRLRPTSSNKSHGNTPSRFNPRANNNPNPSRPPYPPTARNNNTNFNNSSHNSSNSNSNNRHNNAPRVYNLNVS